VTADAARDETEGAMDDLEAIKQLKARYFRCVDTKSWDGLREVFADDAVMDLSATGGEDVQSRLERSPRSRVTEGGDAVVELIRKGLSEAVSVHHGHMPEIEITSPTTATGIWAMEDRVEWPGRVTLHGYGHYHETYGKIDGEWRITRTALTRLRLDVT
jgi:hypothetical protein